VNLTASTKHQFTTTGPKLRKSLDMTQDRTACAGSAAPSFIDLHRFHPSMAYAADRSVPART
jgi:hypothetical protein